MKIRARRNATVVLLVVSLVSLLAFRTCPIIRTPALLKDPGAITAALSDAMANSMFRAANGYDLFASREGARLQHPILLCNSAALYEKGVGDRSCLFAEPRGTSECENAYDCAAIRVDPTILADPMLREAVLAAAANPCGALPSVAGHYSEALVSTLSHQLYLDRLILHCDRWDAVQPRIGGIDASKGTIHLKL